MSKMMFRKAIFSDYIHSTGKKLVDRRGYVHCRQMYAALLEQSRHRNTAKVKKSGWFRR